jgi:hypothetical protein
LNTKTPKKVIVVLGSGRSGTSLIMKTLNALGMDLSKEMIPGRYENPEGFFEDTQIVDIHKKLIESIPFHPTLPMPENWIKTKTVSAAQNELTDILIERVNSAKTIWGFKDPRINAFLPMWIKIFNKANVIPVFILSVRNPVSVAMSLRRLIDRDESISELQWLLRICDALQYTAADCFILHFEQWFIQPEIIAQNLLSYTGLDQFFEGDIKNTIEGIAKPNLDRSSFHDNEITNDFVRDLYETLSTCHGQSFDRNMVMSSVFRAQKAMEGFNGWALEAQKALERNKAKMPKENAEQDLHKIILENNTLLKKNKRLILENDYFVTKVTCMRDAPKPKEKKNTENLIQKFDPKNDENTRLIEKIKRLENRLAICQNSYAFRIGQSITLAVRKPGKNTLLFPFRLIKLMFGPILNRQKK